MYSHFLFIKYSFIFLYSSLLFSNMYIVHDGDSSHCSFTIKLLPTSFDAYPTELLNACIFLEKFLSPKFGTIAIFNCFSFS